MLRGDRRGRPGIEDVEVSGLSCIRWGEESDVRTAVVSLLAPQADGSQRAA